MFCQTGYMGTFALIAFLLPHLNRRMRRPIVLLIIQKLARLQFQWSASSFTDSFKLLRLAQSVVDFYHHQ